MEETRPATSAEVADLVERAEVVFGRDPTMRTRLVDLARESRLSWVAQGLEECERKAATLDDPLSFGYLVSIIRAWTERGGPPRRRGDDATAPPATRADAERLSRDCPHCGGTGQAIRALAHGGPFEITTSTGRTHLVPTAVFACVCPAGRFLARPARDGTPSPFPDLAIRNRLQKTVNPHALDDPGPVPPREAAGLPPDRPSRADKPARARWTDGPAAPTPNVAELPTPTVDPDLARRIAEAAGRAKGHPQPDGA
jgi:hypothetical protein